MTSTRFLQIPAGKSVTILSQKKDAGEYAYTKFSIAGDVFKIHLIELVCGNTLFDTIKPSLFIDKLTFSILAKNVLPAIIFDEYVINSTSDIEFIIMFNVVKFQTPLCRYTFAFIYNQFHQINTILVGQDMLYTSLSFDQNITKISVICTFPTFDICIQMDDKCIKFPLAENTNHELILNEPINFSLIDKAYLYFKTKKSIQTLKNPILHIATETEKMASISNGLIHIL